MSELRKNENAYRFLHAAVQDLGRGLVVLDFPFAGYVAHMKSKVGGRLAVIVIRPQRSWLCNLFLLAHESGHLFNYPTRDQPFGSFSRNRYGHNEKHANEYAVRVCGWLLNRDIRMEYDRFYERNIR